MGTVTKGYVNKVAPQTVVNPRPASLAKNGARSLRAVYKANAPPSATPAMAITALMNGS